jgi:hypothetical protein
MNPYSLWPFGSVNIKEAIIPVDLNFSLAFGQNNVDRVDKLCSLESEITGIFSLSVNVL